jgi:hypothetical protein
MLHNWQHSFDVEETAKLVCGERLGCNRVQIDEGQLEEHRGDKFRIFFKEVCELKHIKEAEDNSFAHRMSSSALRNWKKGIRHLIWDKEMKSMLFSCLAAVEKNTLPTTSLAVDFDTILVKMQPMQQPLHKMAICFNSHTAISRGGKYSGPWDHWSQKIFYAGRKKKGKEEKWGKKEKKGKERKKERKRIERKRE